MNIQTKFDIAQDVKLVTDLENRKRRIIKIIICDKGYTEYLLAYGEEPSSHAECEIEIYEEKPKAGFTHG